MEQVEFSIPAELFTASVNQPTAVHPHSLYPSQKAIEVLLRASCARFGVRPFALGRLLGADDSYIYRWLAGRRRMSSVFLSRLCYLTLLHKPGMDLRSVEKIDWQLGSIHFHDGRITSGDELLQGVFDTPRKPKPVQRRQKAVEQLAIESQDEVVVLGPASRLARGD